MAKQKKVPVALPALIRRLNRALKKDDRRLRYLRGRIGTYCVIDFNLNIIVEQDVDIEAWAREYEVLRPWEEVQ